MDQIADHERSRGKDFDPCYAADLTGATSLEFQDGRLTIVSWTPGEAERVVRKT